MKTTTSSDTAGSYRNAVLLAVITALELVVVGVILGLIAGSWWLGLLIALLVAAALIGLALARSEAIALRVGRAVPADPAEFARYHNLVEGLCASAGLPKPDLFVVHDDAPNAFVAGRSPRRASVAVTTGLFDRLGRIELEGVVAQLLAQVRSPQLLTSTLAVTLGGGLPLLADVGVRPRWSAGGRVPRPGDPPASTTPLAWPGLALQPISALFAPMVRAAAPARRVTLADVAACGVTRYPPGLAAGLERLRDDTTVVASATMGTAHLWLAQPMSGVGDDGELARSHRRFATHPPLDERIALLREL